jgi:hypothetical protein
MRPRLKWLISIAALLSLAVTGLASATRAPAAAAAPAPAAARSPFAHPGLLDGRAQLDYVKGRIRAGAQPWTAAYREALASPYARLGYRPRPRASVDCGPFEKPNLGCTDEWSDAAAAYTEALLWYYTGDTARARKAVSILDSWAATLHRHSGSNAPLQAGWMATVFAQAGEIMRYTYPGWGASRVAAFRAMLSRAFLPLIRNGSGSDNGNWDLTDIEGAMSVAVFLDDRVEFDRQVARWRARLPAYVYLSSDGSLPVPPPRTGIRGRAALVRYWHGPSRFVNGLGQETCRDLAHLQSGLSEALGAAEIAWNQGVDLYAQQARRLSAALEFHARYLLGARVPSWLCGGHLDISYQPTFEIGYRHYHQIVHRDLPLTHRLLQTRLRPTGVTRNMVWETLTHGSP